MSYDIEGDNPKEIDKALNQEAPPVYQDQISRIKTVRQLEKKNRIVEDHKRAVEKARAEAQKKIDKEKLEEYHRMKGEKKDESSSTNSDSSNRSSSSNNSTSKSNKKEEKKS